MEINRDRYCRNKSEENTKKEEQHTQNYYNHKLKYKGYMACGYHAKSKTLKVEYSQDIRNLDSSGNNTQSIIDTLRSVVLIYGRIVHTMTRLAIMDLMRIHDKNNGPQMNRIVFRPKKGHYE